MDEQCCPRCKTTKYRNPSLKLLVNACGHSLCESCVDMLFVKGSGACPQCGTALRRINYRLQVFEDVGVEKEVNIRKKILRDFNKKEDDFASLREYNDYLEMVETIIFNLCHNMDMESTKETITLFRKENKEVIRRNQSKLSKDSEYLTDLANMEKELEATRQKQAAEEDEKQRTSKRKNKDALIDDLMLSDLPALDILASHNNTSLSALPSFVPSAGMQLGHTEQSVFSMSAADVGEPYIYVPLQLFTCGPDFPHLDAILRDGYLNNVRAVTEAEMAGGFMSQFPCQRALQEAMCGLFHCPTIPPPSTSPSMIPPSPNANSPMVVV